MANDPEFCRLLSGLGFYQAQIEAELAKGAKADHDKIAAAFEAGRGFARDAAPYCHSIRPMGRTLRSTKQTCLT
jgi:hypothetical protein